MSLYQQLNASLQTTSLPPYQHPPTLLNITNSMPLSSIPAKAKNASIDIFTTLRISAIYLEVALKHNNTVTTNSSRLSFSICMSDLAIHFQSRLLRIFHHVIHDLFRILVPTFLLYPLAYRKVCHFGVLHVGESDLLRHLYGSFGCGLKLVLGRAYLA